MTEISDQDNKKNIIKEFILEFYRRTFFDSKMYVTNENAETIGVFNLKPFNVNRFIDYITDRSITFDIYNFYCLFNYENEQDRQDFINRFSDYIFYEQEVIEYEGLLESKIDVTLLQTILKTADKNKKKISVEDITTDNLLRDFFKDCKFTCKF